MTVLLHLPFPPSENEANRAGVTKAGKPYVYSSRTKKKFFKDADVLCMARKPIGYVGGPFVYHLIVNRDFRHKNADGQNLDKYVLDYAQKIGVIENDKYAEGGSWAWGACEFGALLRVWPAVASASPETKSATEA